MEALDTDRRVREDIGQLRSWLDEAWNYQSRGAENTTRRVLDLCVAQSELIRQKLTTVKLGDEADKAQAAVAETKKRIKQKRDAIEKAKARKIALETQVK
jgi:hypothetical protein